MAPEELAKLAPKLASMLQDSDSRVCESALQTIGKLASKDLENLVQTIFHSLPDEGDELDPGVFDSLKQMYRNTMKMKMKRNKNQTAFRQAIRMVSSIHTTSELGS